MQFRKKQRIVLLLVSMSLLSLAAILVLRAFDDNIALFATPSDFANGDLETGRKFRIGGNVSAGSVEHDDQGTVHFSINDGVHEVSVLYRGLLPDLFRENQGIVAMGTLLNDGRFQADEVLAKHDERYVPKEVVDALKASGQWRPESQAQ